MFAFLYIFFDSHSAKLRIGTPWHQLLFSFYVIDGWNPAYRYYKPFVWKLLNFHEISISFGGIFLRPQNCWWDVSGVSGTICWMQNQKISFSKTFGDKIVANNEIWKVGPKWHLDIDNLTKICQKNVFQIFSNFFRHIKKIKVISEKLIGCR